MKILLVNPPRQNELVGKNPSIIEKHRGFSPPLGLLYLASAIKKSGKDFHLLARGTPVIIWRGVESLSRVWFTLQAAATPCGRRPSFAKLLSACPPFRGEGTCRFQPDGHS